MIDPPPYSDFMIPVEIRDSTVHGKGLFALRKTKPGQHILTWGGQLFSSDEIDSGKHLEHTAIQISHSQWIALPKNSHRQLDDYMNHSCAPNVGLVSKHEIIATEDIKLGDELVADYSSWLNDPEYTLNPCLCNSKYCRHIISGLEWKKLEYALSHWKILSPYIKSLCIERWGTNVLRNVIQN